MNNRMDTLVRARNLRKVFGELHAVIDLDLSIRSGEIYGLVGPDGAGKTTTIRLLCGAMNPTSGEVTIAGESMSSRPEAARAHIGYLPQHFSLYEELTVLENIRFFAEVRGLPLEMWQTRCNQILDFVGLASFADRWAGQLSGGMKQKLSLATALVYAPKVLLLDEPTTGVDPVTRQDFWQLILRLVNEQKVAVVLSTPYMDEAARCSRLGFMRKGRLLVEGTPAELRARLEGRVVLLQGHPLGTLRHTALADPEVEDAQMFGERLHVRVRPNRQEDVMDRLKQAIPAQGGSITRLGPIVAELEDVFIALIHPDEAHSLDTREAP